jgi:hypothetical protein
LKRYFLFACFICLLNIGFAQSDSLPVKITIDKSNTGDSIWLLVAINKYDKTSSLMFTASLQNKAVQDTFFFPVIDSVSNFCLVFPASIHDNLLLQAWFYPGIFKVSGVINNAKKKSPIKAILITDNAQIYNKEITPGNGNQFSLPALVFENQASLAFNYTDDSKWKSHPDITLTVKPTAVDFKQGVFSAMIKHVDEAGNKQSAEVITATDSIVNSIKVDKKYKELKGVEVSATKKRNVEKFNEEYSTGLFNDGSERIIDCLDNKDILSYPDCISYLQGRVPGFTIGTDVETGGMLAKWRGQEVKAFYIDEIPVDLEQVLILNTSEIAMLKTYPPPFFGSSNGAGGAIAVYTRRGEYGTDKTTLRWLFNIKGYSPQVNVLFNKD